MTVAVLAIYLLLIPGSQGATSKSNPRLRVSIVNPAYEGSVTLEVDDCGQAVVSCRQRSRVRAYKFAVEDRGLEDFLDEWRNSTKTMSHKEPRAVDGHLLLVTDFGKAPVKEETIDPSDPKWSDKVRWFCRTSIFGKMLRKISLKEQDPFPRLYLTFARDF